MPGLEGFACRVTLEGTFELLLEDSAGTAHVFVFNGIAGVRSVIDNLHYAMDQEARVNDALKSLATSEGIPLDKRNELHITGVNLEGDGTSSSPVVANLVTRYTARYMQQQVDPDTGLPVIAEQEQVIQLPGTTIDLQTGRLVPFSHFEVGFAEMVHDVALKVQDLSFTTRDPLFPATSSLSITSPDENAFVISLAIGAGSPTYVATLRTQYSPRSGVNSYFGVDVHFSATANPLRLAGKRVSPSSWWLPAIGEFLPCMHPALSTIDAHLDPVTGTIDSVESISYFNHHEDSTHLRITMQNGEAFNLQFLHGREASPSGEVAFLYRDNLLPKPWMESHVWSTSPFPLSLEAFITRDTTVQDFSNVPPADPTSGAMYIIDDESEGVWAGFKEGNIAQYDGTTWIEVEPTNNQLAWNVGDGYIYKALYDDVDKKYEWIKLGFD